MFRTRHAHTDPDINVDLIRSRLIKKMLGQYDTYTTTEGDPEITFMDPYQRFFFAILDCQAEYKLDIMDYIGEEYEYDSELMRHYRENDTSITLPTFRIFWTVPHHRGKGIQRKVLDEIKKASDEVKESFCIYADPFKLSGLGRETNAWEGLQKLEENGYEPTDNYGHDLYKQRKRFLDLGFWNCKYADAQITQPYQQFVYVNQNAPEEEVKLFLQLRRHYDCPLYDDLEGKNESESST